MIYIGGTDEFVIIFTEKIVNNKCKDALIYNNKMKVCSHLKSRFSLIWIQIIPQNL